jgi:dTDP-4-amino-4,6-dideoxygalactose transaminase
MDQPALKSLSSNEIQPFDFLDLKAQFAPIREEIMASVGAVLDSQHFILGNEVKLFEEECAAFLGARFAISCASGSDALLLALMALGVGRDDEVITSPFTFFATGGSIARLGAKPVFVDIDPETFNLSPAAVIAAMTSRTRAIMPVHLFGLPADMAPLLDLSRSTGIPIVEDAAQAIGARYRGEFVGTLGAIGCFSFFPSKNLGGAGDGGLLTTNDPTLAEQLRILRVHGSRKKYHHELMGINSRLDALQAAILRVKLRHLNDWTRGRQARAATYRKLIDASGMNEVVRAPQQPHREFEHVYNQFSIRVPQRDEVREHLKGRGIPTEIYYPVPLHLQPAFSYLKHRKGQFPHSEQASVEVLALPVYPELTDQQQSSVVASISEFLQARQ